MKDIIKISFLFFSEINLECKGKRYENVTLTAYYPDYTDEDNEKGYLDKKGKNLQTLQVSYIYLLCFCLQIKFVGLLR